MRTDTILMTAFKPWDPAGGREQRSYIDCAGELVCAVIALIDMLPTPMMQAEARVGLMLSLRHTDDVASPPPDTEGGSP